MSKITFRADDDLVEAVESLDASKSEVMRDALRTYLEGSREPEQVGHRRVEESLDELIDRRVNDALEDRFGGSGTDDVTIRLSVEGMEPEPPNSQPTSDQSVSAPSEPSAEATAERAGEKPTCRSCGATLDPGHEYCPSCGERAPTETYCECGTSLEDEWSFCPSCGRRTPPADALDG